MKSEAQQPATRRYYEIQRIAEKSEKKLIKKRKKIEMFMWNTNAVIRVQQWAQCTTRAT